MEKIINTHRLQPDFANSLRLWRKLKGISQSKAAKILGVSQTYVALLESGMKILPKYSKISSQVTEEIRSIKDKLS